MCYPFLTTFWSISLDPYPPWMSSDAERCVYIACIVAPRADCFFIYCHQVCHRLYAVSKTHSVWSSIYRKTACLLPRRNHIGFGEALQLEEMLRRAEIMERIWTGAQPNIPHLQAVTTRSLPIPSTCIGLVGSYVVFLNNKFLRAPIYRWYEVMSPTGYLNLAFEYKIGSDERESQQSIIWHGHHIEAGTNVVNIAALYPGDLAGYKLRVKLFNRSLRL